MFLTQTSVFLCVQCPVKILLSPEAGLHVQKLVVIFFFSGGILCSNRSCLYNMPKPPWVQLYLYVGSSDILPGSEYSCS